jgi:hypothetical protein
MAEHPEHKVLDTDSLVERNVREPAIPILPKGTLGWSIRRACRRAGGHFWHRFGTHSACCNCGVQVEGSPKDGEGTPWQT